MKTFIRNLLKFLGFLSLGLSIMYLLYRSQNKAYQAQCALDGIPAEDCSLIDKVLTDFANANYFWLLMVILLFMISNLSRTARWHMLIRPLGYQPRFVNGLGAIMIGYFANLGIPRIGEVARAGVLARYEKIEVEKVMGTIVVDRIIDVLSILIVTVLALILQYRQIWSAVRDLLDLSTLIKLGVAGAIALLISVALFFLFRKKLEQTRIYQKIVSILKGFVEGLATVRQLDRPWLFLLHSINIWLMYYLLNYLCFFAYEPTSDLSPLVGLVTFVFGGWGIVIPTPGGMGSYHFLVQVALGIYGVSSPDSFSYAMIAFITVQIGASAIFGLISLLLLPFINQGYQPAHAKNTTDVSNP
ncbi:MAG TPA: lysylphosphatidylglycerol synthase transmembrane domain-containing protein [Saprospiraceae bacterium]|nr:lysylphosphatidylglycerol synthase transmembrane domain-containing protein [Saprospiraceae bacterium]